MILGNRYLEDYVSEWELNPIQIKHRQQFLKKLETEKYKCETVKTCLCGGKEFEQLTSKDRYGLPFGNMICKSCGLLICNPRLKKDHLPQFYSEDYHGLVFGSDNTKDLEFMVNKEQGLLIFRFLQKHIAGRGKIRIAELGAGIGTNLFEISNELKKRGIDAEVHGCEYSGACVKYGNEKYKLNLVEGSTEALKDLGLKFDLVIMSHVLEHFTNPFEDLALVKKMLSDDGLLYVEVPGIFDLHNKTVYQCDFLRYTVLAHMYNFSLGTLTNIMELAGFELMEGTEFARSVFRINKTGKPKVLNYYNKTMDYLRNQEQDRRIFYQLSITQANIMKHISQISTEMAGETIKNREDIKKNFDFLGGNREIINKYAEELSTLLQRLQLEFKNILTDKTKNENELFKKFENLLKEKQQSEIEFNKQLADFRSDKQKSDGEYKKQIEDLRLEKETVEKDFKKQIEQLRSNSQAVEDSFKKQIEQLRSDNQAVEAWLKEQIVQILTEKKNSENWLKKQNEALNREKTTTEQKLQNVQAKYDDLNHWHKVMINSLSWKITAPIRKVKEILFPKWKG